MEKHEILTILFECKEDFMEYAEVDEEVLNAFIDKVETKLS